MDVAVLVTVDDMVLLILLEADMVAVDDTDVVFVDVTVDECVVVTVEDGDVNRQRS